MLGPILCGVSMKSVLEEKTYAEFVYCFQCLDEVTKEYPPMEAMKDLLRIWRLFIRDLDDADLPAEEQGVFNEINQFVESLNAMADRDDWLSIFNDESYETGVAWNETKKTAKHLFGRLWDLKWGK